MVASARKGHRSRNRDQEHQFSHWIVSKKCGLTVKIAEPISTENSTLPQCPGKVNDAFLHHFQVLAPYHVE
jgi:hypothetical protein